MIAFPRLIALFAVLAMAGCGTIAPREVLVPVATKCEVVMPDVPAWATRTVTKETGIFDLVKSLLAEREQAIGYQDELRSALLECAELDDPEEAEEPDLADE